MALLNLESGKWLYLAIYLFLPLTTLIFLVRTFGLTQKVDAAALAKRHIEQADYWAVIALNLLRPETGSKSRASLIHTIRRNLDTAVHLLETAVIPPAQQHSLNLAHQTVAAKLQQIQNGPANGSFCHDEPVTFVTGARPNGRSMLDTTITHHL